jgi:hypothetical protein
VAARSSTSDTESLLLEYFEDIAVEDPDVDDDELVSSADQPPSDEISDSESMTFGQR